MTAVSLANFGVWEGQRWGGWQSGGYYPMLWAEPSHFLLDPRLYHSCSLCPQTCLLRSLGPWHSTWHIAGSQWVRGCVEGKEILLLGRASAKGACSSFGGMWESWVKWIVRQHDFRVPQNSELLYFLCI